MVSDLAGLQVQDPFIIFGADWNTVYAGVLQSVDDLRLLAMGSFCDGSYRSMASLADHFAHERPDIGYRLCSVLLDDLSHVLKGESSVIKALKPGSHDVNLLALSESQARMVRSNILHGALCTEYAKLSGITTALAEAMQQEAKLESLVEEYVPKERQLFLLGDYADGRFTYTLKREGERLQHDVRFTKQPLQTVARDLDGHALYRVDRIPATVAQQYKELRMFLLTQYAGIKRMISREKLPHYPLLFASNA